MDLVPIKQLTRSQLLGEESEDERKGVDFVSYVGDDNDNTFYGFASDDHAEMRGGNDTVYGYGGDDIAYGGTGRDTLYGGTDDDTLYDDDGNDYVYGGSGRDTVYGGAGNDTFDTVNADSEAVYGGDGEDRIYSGTFSTISVDGGFGDDYLYIDSVSGEFDGDWNDDVIEVQRLDFGTVLGGAGNDVIRQANLITGDGGSDVTMIWRSCSSG
ncbi:calcium-binding protein [Wenxinia saemankumensis]|uniref:Hemolysin-type calcium-binding repeat-containing protein n=1 Tax=Wenxinia saemankumensis TaxID=1447782 RepID=A0A1M6A591_9RHOB|nr:hypothetical protein [Wenxinia saemankumensis]SHI31363.1 Hemolysin-type calcium-binding repeat-containing protein [Wenxinia saemankumensis]